MCIKKKHFLSILFVSFICLLQASNIVFANHHTKQPVNQSAPVLKIDRSDIYQLPRNFRMSTDKFQGLTKDGIMPTHRGLGKLRESGSSTFSEKEFEKILATVPVSPNQFYDIDLRGESHGYLNGTNVSWFSDHDWGNDGRSQYIIEHIEKDLLQKTLHDSPVKIYRFDDKKNILLSPITMQVNSVRTEEEMVHQHHAHYFRLALMDHFRPDDQAVDKFLKFYKTLPPNAWLHFHCYAGMGRTTIFMVMDDILKNASDVSFHDIVKRQGLIGIVDLSNIPDKKKNWGRKAYFERYQFVRHFYDYVKANPDLKLPWSTWAKKHEYETYTPDYAGYIWSLDAADKKKLPRNFRTSQSPYNAPNPKYNLDKDYIPTRKGLDTLNISGSAQFSVEEFKTMLKKLRTLTSGPIYDIDLRQESHGFFNNNAVSWYGYHDWGNYGKTKKQVIKDENKRIADALHKTLIISPLNKQKLAAAPEKKYIKTAFTEKELAQKEGVNYLRITATDHIWPSSECVDQFINFSKTLPADAWLHFHCHAGVGRTTAYMAMYDIMKNPSVSLKDILYRQHLIGGNYVAYTVENPKKGIWKADYYNDKARMIKLFYKYVQENYKNNYKLSWTNWLQQNDK
ncbi:phosphatase domain-containing putative toxin [Pectinatus sottacetonis]|uniref:phosphatase domain-containing putative toxin n=1 Tax=Pectinatus sottacetonis TaxID=1002795 RepID=UPI0018C683D2|nr:hypothetical protein [Pectinatus sottacetonis]